MEQSNCVVLLKEPLYHCAMCKKIPLFKLQGVKSHLVAKSKKTYGMEQSITGSIVRS